MNNMLKDGDVFGYRPLPSPTYIRLLRILSRYDEPIRCSLETVDLCNEPRYHALSYTWGDPLSNSSSSPNSGNTNHSSPARKRILCDGHDLSLTATDNLLAVIGELSTNPKFSDGIFRSREDLIWIDAICINQKNASEKNVQIAMMDRIYKNAETVIIWLGPRDNETSMALEVMRQIIEIPAQKASNQKFTSSIGDEEIYQTLDIPYIEPYQWQAYASFLQRTWFSRIWVVQEAFFARKIHVILGTEILKWSDITSAARFLRDTNLGTLLMNHTAKDLGENYVRNILTNVYIFERMRERIDSMNLEWLLTNSRFFDATYSQDKVIAILGLWKESSRRQGRPPGALHPDCTLSVEEVYTQAAWTCIQEMGDLNILSLVEDASFRKAKSLPSWVPDFSVGSQPHPLAGNPRPAIGNQRWDASCALEWNMPVPKLEAILPVYSVQIDTIVDFAATQPEILEHYDVTSLLRILRDCSTTADPYQGNCIDAFWRTLIKDTFREEPADLRARELFQWLIIMRVWELQTGIQQFRERSDPNIDPLDPYYVENARQLELYNMTQQLLSEVSRIYGKSEVIPDWSTIQEKIRSVEALVDGSTEATDLGRDYDDISEAFRIAYGGRRLFKTKKGLLGISAQSLARGDTICVIAGVNVPFVVRKLQKEGYWKLIGEAYIHGIMNGEVFKEEDVVRQSIYLE
ncbi:hypothetical protein BP6252_09979 [Coleophoma cylindrospora]|uniref:Heterokaryon incompatibility domain-containing protein n=1 Tax=Coleophoma cylindrospora TaxID=1849047 RepID=A0A3D8QXT2_9HELO|nr:hypothetical protein BP6252_09979 [Coleophoma cylindrospora]